MSEGEFFTPMQQSIRRQLGLLSRRVASVVINEVITAPLSPWQNPYVERVIGSIRRECLNYTIIIGERHLRRIVGNYVRYYNQARTHLSLNKDSPFGRPVVSKEVGSIVSRPHCGGLHHEYSRAVTSEPWLSL